MTRANRSFLRSYAVLLAVALLTGVLVAVVGYVPTARMTSDLGVRSMLAGCAISWIASCVGAIPLALMNSGGRSGDATLAVLSATALRFLAVLVLVVPAVFVGWFERTVLVLWVALSYLVILGVDTTVAVRMLRSTRQGR